MRENGRSKRPLYSIASRSRDPGRRLREKKALPKRCEKRASILGMFASLASPIMSHATEHASPSDALLAAINANDVARVAALARALGSDIDRRYVTACEGLVCLTAPPHIFAAYYGHDEVLDELLARSGDQIDERATCWCTPNKRCAHRGRTPLQHAVSSNSVECVRALLRAGANAGAPFCFPVDAADAPADSSAIDGGVATCTALQIAKRRGHETTCELLKEHGASDDAHPDSECSICYESLVDTVHETTTTPCGHCFHARCLRPVAVRNCPLCRTPLRKDNDPLAASEDAGADGEEEAPSLSLLQRAILASTFASWNESDEALGTTRPVARTGGAETPSQCLGRAEPPYLRSSSWAPPPVRTYSEIERRRL